MAQDDEDQHDWVLAMGVLIGIAVVVGIVVVFWQLAVVLVAVAAAVWLVRGWWLRRRVFREVEAQHYADVKSRADAEHQAWLRSERRGTFGDYEPPTV